ncbi:MAG: DUF378 domain-containing protein [bacterium]
MIFQKIILVFTIIGGINWGLIGFFDFNLVEFITANNSMISNVIYCIVGICAIINICILFSRNRDM